MFDLHRTKSTEEIRMNYDALYSQRWIEPRSSLFIWLLGLLKIKPGQTLLDVACGEAELGHLAHRKGIIYYGVDISIEAIKLSTCRVAVVGDGSNLPFSENHFDYVICIGSLEHFVEIAQGVGELARVVKDDGMVCILVPNAFGITWNVLNVWKTGDLADDGQPIQRFGTRNAWQRLIEANGLMVVRILGYERLWPNTQKEIRFYLSQPKELILALLTPFIPTNLKRCFVFLCKKANNGKRFPAE
jgi:SAM-dependent methyltransferase